MESYFIFYDNLVKAQRVKKQRSLVALNTYHLTKRACFFYSLYSGFY